MNDISEYMLVKPDASYEEEWNNYTSELMQADGKIIPRNLEATDFKSFLKQIKRLEQGVNLPDGYVPSELYFCVSKKNKKRILGVGDMRLEKSTMLDMYFGQGGGSVRPSERGKGLGKIFINLCLQKAKNQGFKSIILTCEKGNVASKKAIEQNGGVFIGNSYLNERIYERYSLSIMRDK